jgi:5-methyltetrahydropteroyltriglutamate--homocysteine methyltransferase
MQHSRQKILTTHVGSLPRSDALVELLVRKEEGDTSDAREFDEAVRHAVADVVARQIALDIDVISDGEMSKINYATYVKDRLPRFANVDMEPKILRDMRDFPALRRKKDAVAARRAGEAFINAASPGVVASFLPNTYYPTHETYIEALAEVLREEYEAIAASGFLLQIDCPDLAMSRHTVFQDLTEAEFLGRAALHVEALNHALRNVPIETVRIHICWGNYEGPHTHDIELRRVIDIALRAKAGAISFEAANPRHGHEWAVWRDTRLPDDRILLPGVIDTSTNFVEHPEFVAQRIAQFAVIVGRERVIASTDCGFGTSAGYGKIDPDVAYLKLDSLVKGAAIASARLWD